MCKEVCECLCVFVHALCEDRMHAPHSITCGSEDNRLGIQRGKAIDLSIKMLQIHEVKFTLLNFIKIPQVLPSMPVSEWIKWIKIQHYDNNNVKIIILPYFFVLTSQLGNCILRPRRKSRGAHRQSNAFQTSSSSALALLTTVILRQSNIHLVS